MTSNYTRRPENGHAAPPVAASPSANLWRAAAPAARQPRLVLGAASSYSGFDLVPRSTLGGRRGKPRFFLHYEEEDSSAKVIAHD